MLYKFMRKTFFALCISCLVFGTGCGQKSDINVDIEEINNYEQEDNSEENIDKDDLEVSDNEEINISVDDTEEKSKEEEMLEEKISVEKMSEEEPDNEIDLREEKRVKVKGIYVSGPVAGISRMDDLIAMVEETELNAIVIDIKNDEGKVTYKMDSPLVNEVGSSIRYIKDIDALVQKCKEKNIYLIARIVAFKDPVLAETKKELAIHLKDGAIYRDNAGLAWVNPYEKEVWEYLREIGIEAAKVGFDEIQYDYIRFSTDISANKVDFGENAIDKSKTEIITEFTKYITEELKPYGVFVAADVYGTIIDSEVDQKIVGQDYISMSKYLDYICPMVYPSHYANGVYGLSVPDAKPYETVKYAMQAATEQLNNIPENENKAINRVWIQSFTAKWVNGHISYGPAEIRAQIKGAYDAGYEEWILWNAAMKYQRDSLLTEEEALIEKQAWDQELETANQ